MPFLFLSHKGCSFLDHFFFSFFLLLNHLPCPSLTCIPLTSCSSALCSFPRSQRSARTWKAPQTAPKPLSGFVFLAEELCPVHLRNPKITCASLKVYQIVSFQLVRLSGPAVATVKQTLRVSVSFKSKRAAAGDGVPTRSLCFASSSPPRSVPRLRSLSQRRMGPTGEARSFSLSHLDRSLPSDPTISLFLPIPPQTSTFS